MAVTTKVPSEWEVDGWRIRLAQGRKAADDVQIWVASPGGDYCLLRLSSLGAVIRLWHDNEDRLYPKGLGGLKVLMFLEACCTFNLVTACRIHQLRTPAVKRLDSANRSTP